MIRESRRIQLGPVAVGGGAPVSIQSMCNTPTRDAAATLAQIESLRRAGCDITRVSIDTPADAAALRIITTQSPLPVVADIQFDGPMALSAIEAGAAGIRLNPGIISDRSLLEKIARSAAERNVPIRVGANAGSLKKHEIDDRINRGLSHDDAIADALISVALRQCELLESFGVTAIKVALKSSSVPVTVRANTEFARRTDYPLHLGLTEAGTPNRGIVKSAVAVGAMLLAGIGDTMRVSLTAPPEAEVAAAQRILEAAGVREALPELVSCPSCGRTEIDLFSLAGKVEALVDECKRRGENICCRKIAVMGCPVNGPGEARDADIGLAGSKNGQLLLFRRGKVLGAFDAASGFEKIRTMLVQETEKD